MADVLEYAAHLAQEIGARPGGTEEEQQASFFIEETMNEAGLATSVEEFNCNPGYETTRIVCCIVSVVAAMLAFFIPLAVIPAFIITIITAILFALELLDISPIGKSSRKGISQNVVGIYMPDGSSPTSDDILLDVQAGRGRRGGASRKRKIVLVASYDSGKVRRELKGATFKVLPFLPWIEIGGMALIPIMLLIRIATTAADTLLVVINVLLAVGVVAALIPVLIFLLGRTAAYTDGANNNASGVAVMLEVAKRIASSANEDHVLKLGQASSADDSIVMHGEEAAISSGLLPTETDLVYEEASSKSLASEGLEHEAARTQGFAGEDTDMDADAVTIPFGGEVVNGVGASAAEAGSVQAVTANPRMQVFEVKKEEDNVPDWFKKGIAAANAKKTPQEKAAEKGAPARSRFSDALDAAAEASEKSIEEFEARDALRKMDEARNKANSFEAAVFTPSDGTVSLVADAPLSKTSSDLQASIAAKVEEAQTHEAEALAQAVEGIVEQVDQADRTISFIPVAADIPEEIAIAADAGQSGIIAKTPEEILAEATAITEEGIVPEAATTRKNKRRAIALPSLTGAIEAINVKAEEPVAVTEDVVLEDTHISNIEVASEHPVRKSASKKKQSDEDAATAVASLDSKVDTFKEPKETHKEDLKEARKETRKSASKKKLAPIEPVAPVAEAPQLSFLDVAPGASGMDNDDIVIEDVDDSAYEVNTTITGAPAGPSYVEMPKSRGDRLRGIFGRKKKTEEPSFAEAMGLDSDYDARSVGTARGSWESFQNESANYDAKVAEAAQQTFVTPETSLSELEEKDNKRLSRRRSRADEHGSTSRARLREKSWDDGAWDDDDWNGGAFSLGRIGESAGSLLGRKGKETDTDGKQHRKAPGDMLAAMAADAADEANGLDAFAVTSAGSNELGAEDMLDERERIRSFRTSSAPLTSFAEVAAFASSMAGETTEDEGEAVEAPRGFQTEVWFVALGAQLSNNAGMKAFLAEHASELRGAVVIDIEALGAGELSVVDEEGIIRRRKAPSRMKRYVSRAASALGMRPGNVKMNWRESASYLAASKGMTSIHIAGVKDDKPAYMGELADTMEHLNEEKMLEGAAFTLELLHLI